jgi:hypothetical protein
VSEHFARLATLRCYKFIIASAILEMTCAASHGRFRNLFRHLVRLIWKSDQPVVKACIYTRHTTQKDERNMHTLNGIRTHDPSNQAINAFASDSADTGTGSDVKCTYLVYKYPPGAQCLFMLICTEHVCVYIYIYIK